MIYSLGYLKKPMESSYIKSKLCKLLRLWQALLWALQTFGPLLFPWWNRHEHKLPAVEERLVLHVERSGGLHRGAEARQVVERESGLELLLGYDELPLCELESMEPLLGARECDSPFDHEIDANGLGGDDGGLENRTSWKRGTNSRKRPRGLP